MAVLVALCIRFLYPKLKLAYQLHKAKTTKEMEENRSRFYRRGRNNKNTFQRSPTEEDELQIEKTPDMELYTQVGKFVVNM